MKITVGTGPGTTKYGGTNWSQPNLPGCEITPAGRIKLASHNCWVSRRFALLRDRSKAVKQQYEKGSKGQPLISYPRVYFLHTLNQEWIDKLVRFLAEQQIEYEIL